MTVESLPVLDQCAKIATDQAAWERQQSKAPGIGKKDAACHANAAMACDMVAEAILKLALTTPSPDRDEAGEGQRYQAAVKGRQDFRAAYRRLWELFDPTDEEIAAIREMGEDSDLSPKAVMRQALRHYQKTHFRLKAGETLSFSGDAQRAADFAGPLAFASLPAPVNEGEKQGVTGASVPDRALLAPLTEPASSLVPPGDDPSRIAQPDYEGLGLGSREEAESRN